MLGTSPGTLASGNLMPIGLTDSFGVVHIEVPGDRMGTSEPQIVKNDNVV